MRHAPATARRRLARLFGWLFCWMLSPGALALDSLPQTIERVKPALVGIGTFQKTRSPAVRFLATGFAVGAGGHVVTNAHAVDKPLDLAAKESLIVLVSQGGEPRPREVELLETDRDHDLALLKVSGPALPALKIGDSGSVREGQVLFITGFPIGMVLGFHPATHRAMIAAITPVALPGITSRELNARMVARIRSSVYSVFQLDGTAYPGNSGSPLYDAKEGTVYGILNSGFVQGTREAAISHPSGISYAIPAKYIVDMLKRQKVEGYR
ncbi:MAG: S1 family peptidase [Betaproteobacteria bacterium]